MRTINKIIIGIGSFLMGVGVLMFMYNTKVRLRIYLIIIGLVIVGAAIITSILEGSRLSIKKINENKNND